MINHVTLAVFPNHDQWWNNGATIISGVLVLLVIIREVQRYRSRKK